MAGNDTGSGLNDSEFTAKTRAGGGASRDVRSHVEPTSGYMVGRPPGRDGTPGLPTRNVSLSTFGESAVQEHLTAIHKHYGDLTGIHQGSWVNHDGSVDLDASERIADRSQALEAGARRHEQAIYDLNKDSEVEVTHWLAE